MKASSWAFVACCVIAASAVAFSDVTFTTPCSNQEPSPFSDSSPAGKGRTKNSGRKAISEKEKFAQRFDGLRFIETLVTAHR